MFVNFVSRHNWRALYAKCFSSDVQAVWSKEIILCCEGMMYVIMSICLSYLPIFMKGKVSYYFNV